MMNSTVSKTKTESYGIPLATTLQDKGLPIYDRKQKIMWRCNVLVIAFSRRPYEHSNILYNTVVFLYQIGRGREGA